MKKPKTNPLLTKLGKVSGSPAFAGATPSAPPAPATKVNRVKSRSLNFAIRVGDTLFDDVRDCAHTMRIKQAEVIEEACRAFVAEQRRRVTQKGEAWCKAPEAKRTRNA